MPRSCLQRSGPAGLWLGVLLCVALAGSGVSQAQLLYFSNGPDIESAELDGANRRPFVTFAEQGQDLVDMTADPVSQKLYWAVYDANENVAIFYRAAPKAKTPEEIFRMGQGGDYRSIAVDGVHGKIYWARSGATDAIQRANLDGTQLETLVSGVGIGLFAIAVFPQHDELYWTSTTVYGQQGTIHRATLAGANADSLVTRQGWPASIAIDRAAGKIYWADRFWNVVKRANHGDGGNIESVVSAGKPIGIAIDNVNAKLYWVDTVAQKLQWADLDGSNPADLLSVAAPERLCLLPGTEVGVKAKSWSDVRRRFR